MQRALLFKLMDNTSEPRMPDQTDRDLPTVVEVDQFMPSFVSGGMGGTETYARQVFNVLNELPGVSVCAVLPQGSEDFASTGTSKVMPLAAVSATTAGRLKRMLEVLLRRRKLYSLLRDSAVTFVPFTTPLLPVRKLSPVVITFHDVQHQELPELFSRFEKVYRYFTYERPARQADHIITVSEYAKQSIVRELRINPSRITAIPLGVDTSSFTPNLGEREDFVYYPARGWLHKNHQRLIEAMEIVRQTHPELRLVLTGGALDSLGDLPEWVDNRGLVSFTEVQELFQKAKVLAFPSLYEGFGFPPLEAMASGTPVAASTAASIPEICGDAVVYFNPFDVDSIAEGILAAINDRDRLVPLGLERVKQFTWEKCAKRHAEVFRRVAHDGN